MANNTPDPCIICVAITRAKPMESTHAVFQAEATSPHAHVRVDERKPTSNPVRFAQRMDDVQRHCPCVVLQLSTGGRSGAGQTRRSLLGFAPSHHRSHHLPRPDATVAIKALAAGVRAEIRSGACDLEALAHRRRTGLDLPTWPAARTRQCPSNLGPYQTHRAP